MSPRTLQHLIVIAAPLAVLAARPTAGRARVGLGITAAAPTGVAAKMTKVSGSAELTYDKQEAIPVSGVQEHVLIVGEARGTNKNTGSGDFFADADVVNPEIDDIDHGNGTHQGYYMMTKNGSSATAKWHGQVTSTMGPDNQPRTSFKGTWEYTGGTGEYSGIKGSGTYEGQFLAKDRYAVRWQGEYQK